MNTESRPATEATLRAQAALAARLPTDTGEDFADARRGFLGTLPDGKIVDAEGRVFWNMGSFDFEAGDAPCPGAVNPSLWRQARLNAIHGLFEVTPGVYQVRGFDISNITFVEGKRGLIVIDPLTSAAPAAAALRLMRAHRGEKPVTAVIYTHSHVDHYGGVRGVLSEADIAAGVPIVAPEGFLEAAHLIDAGGDLEESVERVEPGLPPQAGIHRVRALALKERVGRHAPGAVDGRVRDRADEPAPGVHELRVRLGRKARG